MKVEMRTTQPGAKREALNAWVNEHGDEFDNVAV